MTEPDDHAGTESESSFRHHLISLGEMDRSQRALTAIVLAQIIAAALLLAFRDIGGPSITLFGEPPLTLSLVHYLAAVISCLMGLTLFAFGIAETSPRGIAGVTLLVFVGYIAFIFEPTKSFDYKNSATNVFWLHSSWIALLAGVVAMARHRAAIRPYLNLPQSKVGAALFLLFFGGLALTYLIFIPFIDVIRPTEFFFTLIVLRTPLGLLFLSAGADWAEMGDTVVRSLTTKLAGAWLPLATAAAASLLFLLILARHSTTAVPIWNGLWPEAIAALVLVAIFAVSGPDPWPIRFPFVAVLVAVGAIVIFREWMVLLGFSTSTLGVWVLAITVTAACVCGRLASLRPFAPTALLAVITALCFLSNGRYTLGASLDTAAVTLCIVGWTALRRGPRDLRPLQFLLWLNASLAFIWLLFVVYGEMLASGEGRVLFDAFFLAVSMMWDVLTAGAKVNSGPRGLFPRRSRLFLFYGFVAMTLAVLIGFFPLRAVPGSAPAETLDTIHVLLNPDAWVQVGIAEFGHAMVWALFAIRMRNWIATRGWPAMRSRPAAQATS